MVRARPSEGHREKQFTSMETIDKETERLIKRIERAARIAKLQRLSQEECRRLYRDLETSMREQEIEIEC